MLSSIRRRMTYANVVASLALLFAMSGGAIAATHYLITSQRQISPKVLKTLKGSTGRRGATGAAGAPGAPGAPGASGAPGTALGYASVIMNSVGNPTLIANSGFTSVTEPQAGEFCVGPLFPGHPVITSPAGGSNDASVSEVSDQQCPTDYEVAVTNGVAFAAGQGFNIVAP